MITVPAGVNSDDEGFDELDALDRTQVSDKPLAVLRNDRDAFLEELACDPIDQTHGLWVVRKYLVESLDDISGDVASLLTEARRLEDDPGYVVNETTLEIAMLQFATYKMTAKIEHQHVFTEEDEADVSTVLKELNHLKDALKSRIKKLSWEIREFELHLSRTTASIMRWEQFGNNKPFRKDLLYKHLSPTPETLRRNRMDEKFLVNHENEFLSVLQYCNVMINGSVDLAELDVYGLDSEDSRYSIIMTCYGEVQSFVEAQAALDFVHEDELMLPGGFSASSGELKRIRQYAAFQDVLSRVVAASEMANFNKWVENGSGSPIETFSSHTTPPVSVDGRSVLTGDPDRDRVASEQMLPLEGVVAACLLYSKQELRPSMNETYLWTLLSDRVFSDTTVLLHAVEKLYLYAHVDTERFVDDEWCARDADAFVTMITEGVPEDWAFAMAAEETDN